MAAAKEKTTFTAAEVAELLRPLNQSIQALQEENAALKKKLGHMNEIFINAQRARFGRSSEKQTYIWAKSKCLCLTKRKRYKTRMRKSQRKKLYS